MVRVTRPQSLCEPDTEGTHDCCQTCMHGVRDTTDTQQCLPVVAVSRSYWNFLGEEWLKPS